MPLDKLSLPISLLSLIMKKKNTFLKDKRKSMNYMDLIKKSFLKMKMKKKNKN
jgi:hypothetical protein